MSTGPARGEDDDSRDGTGEDGWDEIVLDEDFVRGAQANEPAARARMLQARWRDDPPEPQPWRADAPPAGWFWSKARRRARRRRRGK
ncbi:MAG TPA: hypothetical protein VFY14_02535 [Streptomyces sp.]|nr:hypothetical protein [Streptomyces sp.]